jgi:hypothetical protein
MEVTFLTHDTYFLKKMEGLSFGRWLFFSVWITEYLYKQYGEKLRPAFLEEEDLDLREVLAFLWQAVEKANAGGHALSLNAPLTLDEEQMTDYIEGLGNDEIYSDLDQTETQDMGQACLISAFYNSLTFIRDREIRLVAAAAFFPMDIIDCILTNDLELSPKERSMEHPMYQAELAVQEKMIEYLQSGKEVGEAQKDLFRTA